MTGVKDYHLPVTSGALKKKSLERRAEFFFMQEKKG